MDIGSFGTGEGQFAYIQDFAFGRDGQLLVTDASHAWIQLFDGASGRYLARFGGRGGGERNLVKPEGIAVDTAGNIYVADFNLAVVKAYDVRFNWLRTFGDFDSERDQLAKPTLMDIRDGRLYVPDIGTDRIYVFDLAGKPLFNFGGLGTGPGEFANPRGIMVDKVSGRVFVADTGNNRIQVFRPVGDKVGAQARAR
jgi:DNA-binding beta-propeller fold protein YncE